MALLCIRLWDRCIGMGMGMSMGTGMGKDVSMECHGVAWHSVAWPAYAHDMHCTGIGMDMSVGVGMGVNMGVGVGMGTAWHGVTWRSISMVWPGVMNALAFACAGGWPWWRCSMA